jgi:hypothetical protein
MAGVLVVVACARVVLAMSVEGTPVSLAACAGDAVSGASSSPAGASPAGSGSAARGAIAAASGGCDSGTDGRPRVAVAQPAARVTTHNRLSATTARAPRSSTADRCTTRREA